MGTLMDIGIGYGVHLMDVLHSDYSYNNAEKQKPKRLSRADLN